jgi:hypothetical protein
MRLCLKRATLGPYRYGETYQYGREGSGPCLVGWKFCLVPCSPLSSICLNKTEHGPMSHVYLRMFWAGGGWGGHGMGPGFVEMKGSGYALPRGGRSGAEAG